MYFDSVVHDYFYLFTLLIGNIESLKKQHEEELATFQQAQEENRIRMQTGLQEKLNARRRRRIQIMAQEAEQRAFSQND